MKIFKVLLAAAFILVSAPACTNAADQMLHDEVRIQTKSGEEFLFNVELALTGAQQAKGLMGRTVLAENGGMLFVFKSEKKRSFWMKNTYIPLDMIFIAKDGTIQHIHHSAKPQDETQITSLKPALAVLEINGGFADRLEISEGDMVIHPVFNNTNKLAQ